MSFGPLVTQEWLAAHLNHPDLALLDASFFLPNEGRNADAEFVGGRIPGSRRFDIDLVADPETDLPHMVPSAGRFSRLVGALGIANTSRVVVYDRLGLRAARAWWLFGLFGHDQVAVLDGGFAKWTAAGLPVETGQPPAPIATPFNADLRAEKLRGLGDMRRIVAEKSALILDARPAGRFDGTAPEPRPGLPSGHMPGAKNLPAGSLLAPDQTLLPAPALREKFASLGADGRSPIVTSCGTGVTAAILTLALTVAGIPAGALYDGSWTEWAGRPDTPKES